FLGSESLRNWAQAGVAQSQRDAERVAATIASFGDIDDAGDFFDWAAGAIGEQVPNLALVFGSGGVGGGVGGAVVRTALRSAIKHELRDRATRELRQQLGASVTAQQIRDRVTSQLSDPATQRLLRQAMTRGA